MCTSCLFSLLLNEDVVDIGKPDGICSLTFVADEVSGLLLHPSIFSYKHSRSAQKLNSALPEFWYWLNSGVLGSSDSIIKLQISLFSDACSCDSSYFLF